jgi:tRNA dimethylallyltransferase
VIDPGAALRERIDGRFDAMIGQGWLDEVRALSAVVPDDAPAWKASGYGALREVVAGRTGMDEAKERILIETRQYAKRQRTWFRHQLPGDLTTRLDPAAPDADNIADRWLAGVGAAR